MHEMDSTLNELHTLLDQYRPSPHSHVLLIAFCDPVVSSYQLYTGSPGQYQREDPDLPGDPMKIIRHAYQKRTTEWTGFLLASPPGAAPTLEYRNDLNPLLDAGQAIDWLAYEVYRIEPDGDWAKQRLEKALKSETFKSTLAYACIKKDTEAVLERLPKASSRELDRKVSGYGTPLHIACAHRNLELVRLLVEAGADTAKTHNRHTPLEQAYTIGALEIADYLARIDPQANEASLRKGGLFLVVNCRDASLIASVVRGGAEVNQINSKAAGLTPLHMAAYADNDVAVAALIGHGADPSIEEKHGRTPLHYAVQFGKTAAIEALIEAGVNPNLPNSEGETPLHAAEKYAQTDAVKLLKSKIEQKN
ncbi:ankyrin repeat domain-containing protein [Saccharibacillus sacchari]|uniref:ankyrin repeat domain-containing protein n=1 Tax=Saccharibacillus sacchari TaxID=456493 RepID=UPI0004B8EA4D|nr:ankyrin repeat domain-containing protein [Saccharibacillus sacchari]